MFEAAQQFERAAAHAAQRAAADRVRRRLLDAITGPEDEPPPPAPRFDEQARLFFYSTLAPLVAWTIRACLAVLAVAVLSVGTYGLVWGAIMRGLDVRSRPVFFDYAPGGATVPVGVVDLRSAKSAPWAHSCGDFGNHHLPEGDVCVQSEKDGSADATTAILDSGQRYFFELTLTLPESEVNRQLGVFMINIGLRSDDGTLLASSKQHSMLPYESALVSLFRKTMLLLPLASGLLSETRDIDLLCFDNYVDADSEKPMSSVELSIGVPHPASFPDTRQTIQIHSATLRYGREMNALQTFLRNWRYSAAFFGTTFLFLLYALLALSVVNYRWMNSARNRQPYANFFDSDDDESAAQYADAASQDRWMGADIEIIEDDEDDSNAWEPIDSKNEKKESAPKESPLEEPTENDRKGKSSVPSDNLVSEDDESLTDKKNTPRRQNGRGKAKSANSKEFPFGTIARDASVEGHEPMFVSPKSKPSSGAESKKRTEGSRSGSEGKKPLETKDKAAQLKEEMRLADMVMKGQSKYGSFKEPTERLSVAPHLVGTTNPTTKHAGGGAAPTYTTRGRQFGGLTSAAAVGRATMANTEGLSDAAVSSMLAMPSPEEEQQQRRPRGNAAASAGPAFPRRSMARREQMMELGEGETPAATVVRSSKPPKIRASASLQKRGETARIAKQDNSGETSPDTAEEANTPHINEGRSDNNAANIPKPVILSQSIRERPVDGASTEGSAHAPTAPVAAKRVSRFKQRNLAKNIPGSSPTAGGFPSLDIAPVGAFTRNGRTTAPAQNPTNIERAEAVPTSTSTATASTTKPIAGKDAGLAADSMLANMSLEEIRSGVEEVQSILSAESIEFLRKRGRQRLASSKESGMRGSDTHRTDTISSNTIPALAKREELQLEKKKEQEEKEKMAELLSSVRTPDDMDRVYKEALQLGLAPELPASSLNSAAGETSAGEDGDERTKNLHTATSLLRSTAPRQRLLGARTLCHILEEDAKIRRSSSFSACPDDRKALRKTYPQLLPVAIRCLLDDSIATFQTSGGRLLLSLVLRCIRALMALFVHRYHVVDVTPETSDGCSDPFVLYQTCFMKDVSHVPPGTELYAPTQITPIAGEANKASCYRADSSAATAESDSKAFYNDPAWTLLSRMRILPCLSDVLRCLSADYATGTAISQETIQSICGILAMLAVRSPGAAGAIARHKGILPFLISYCLSPSDSIRAQQRGQSKTKSEGLFDTGAAIPALMLLCHLARQSRDIAELEMPFQAVIPDLQAMLLVEAGSESKEDLQMKVWSLILLRLLIRYGLATEHAQTLIGIVAPRVELVRPEDSISAQYLSLFVNICEASRVAHPSADGGMTTVPEEEGNLAMAGVWLTPTVSACSSSFLSVVGGQGRNHMTLASSQLRLLASFVETSSSTKEASSIPILSNEACVQVVKAALESEMMTRALNIALQSSFNANWDMSTCDTCSLEEEAIACAFISSFTSFVNAVEHEALGTELHVRVLNKIMSHLEQLSAPNRRPSAVSTRNAFHPARQSWFVESEFAVLRMLCAGTSGKDSHRELLPAFAFSLLGRLNIGHEAMAAAIFREDILFPARNGAELASSGRLQALFLRELSVGERKLQLSHSSNLYFSRGQLSSLRCTADYVGSSNDNNGDRYVLPLGGIWMWKVLSSTNSQPDGSPLSGDDHVEELSAIVSETLSILLHLEKVSQGSCYLSSINNGTKLYHLSNVCLLPEPILSNELVASALEALFKRLTDSEESSEDPSLVQDFIQACFEHSRLSRDTRNIEEEGNEDADAQLQDLLNPGQPSSGIFSQDELKALDDFVDDLCQSYIEWGGQYASFTKFIKFLLRDFPAKTMATIQYKVPRKYIT